MNARSLLALANLNKRDRYLTDRAKLQTAKKEDWRWVGFDSTIGMGVVRSGNITKRGKVITNGYLVPGQPVEFNEDGQFATIEGMPHIRPQPRRSPQFVPTEDPVLSFKIAYRAEFGGVEQIWVGGWSESPEYGTDDIPSGFTSPSAAPRNSYPNVALVNFDNLGGAIWRIQALRVFETGRNAANRAIYDISIDTITSGQVETDLIFSGIQDLTPYPSNPGALMEESGFFSIMIGGSYTIVCSSTRTRIGPINNPTGLTYSGLQRHLWNGAIQSVSQPAYTTPFSAGGTIVYNGQSLSPALGESYYQIPESGILQVGQPLATDGLETLVRVGVGVAATYFIATSGGPISIPTPAIEFIGTDDYQINSTLAVLKMLNRKIYYVPRSEMTLSNLTTANPGETGSVTVNVCDLVAGTVTTVQDTFYKVPNTATEILSCCYYPETAI